ncbi:MAG: hypothetical protein ACLFRV_08395 [Acidimicrobiales bacterium]
MTSTEPSSPERSGPTSAAAQPSSPRGATAERGKDWWQRRGRWLALESAGIFAFCSAIVIYLFRAWQASLRVPFYLTHDARLVQVYVRNTLEHGWWHRNPELGAPFGGTYLDLPHGGEQLQFLALKVLGTILGNDVGLTINVYYLAGFGLTAVVAHLVLRHLGFSWPVAALVSIAFTFLPFHFAHHQQHLWRSVYPNVALMALLIVWCASARRSFLRDPDATTPRGHPRLRDNLRTGMVAVAAVLVVVVGSWETMMIAFGASVLASVGIVVALRQRDWVPLAAAGAVVAATIAVFAVQMAPSLLHWASEGTNDEGVGRLAVESEYYGLKLSRVLLPEFNHRSERLGDLGFQPINNSPVPSENGQSLGLIGAAGFVAAGVIALGWGLVRRPRPPDDRRQLLGVSATSAMIAVLFGTIGGLSVILAIGGFSQIRVWNRIVVLIAFFSLVIVAVGLERAVAWLRARPRAGGHAAAWVLLGCLLVLNLWDTARVTRPDYEAITAETEQLRGFVRQIESQLPDDAALFQYPVIPFPEHPPVHGMVDYDHFAGYLQSESLRWSYGAVKGRPEADWQQTVGDMAVPDALPVIAGMGFDGIWVDRAGFADHGDSLVAQMMELVGDPQMSGRYVFFDLRDWVATSGYDRDELVDVAHDALEVEPPS